MLKSAPAPWPERRELCEFLAQWLPQQRWAPLPGGQPVEVSCLRVCVDTALAPHIHDLLIEYDDGERRLLLHVPLVSVLTASGTRTILCDATGYADFWRAWTRGVLHAGTVNDASLLAAVAGSAHLGRPAGVEQSHSSVIFPLAAPETVTADVVTSRAAVPGTVAARTVSTRATSTETLTADAVTSRVATAGPLHTVSPGAVAARTCDPAAPSSQPHADTHEVTSPAEEPRHIHEEAPGVVVKILRVVEPGVNPDRELTQALAAAGWDRVPQPVAWSSCTWEDPHSGATLCADTALAARFIPMAQDGFTLMCSAARAELSPHRGTSTCVPATAHTESAGDPRATASGNACGAGTDAADADADAHTAPTHRAQSWAHSCALMEDLGRTTAQMHAALAAATGWAPAPAPTDVARDLEERLRWACQAVPALSRYTAPALALYAQVARCEALPPRTRIHGDYHLGQVLHSAVSELRGAVPELRSAVPELRSAVPELRSAVPELHSTTGAQTPTPGAGLTQGEQAAQAPSASYHTQRPEAVSTAAAARSAATHSATTPSAATRSAAACASAESGWFVLDFEGEPLRPLEHRCRPDLPHRDVAGMLRSCDYAAAVGTQSLAGQGPDAGSDPGETTSGRPHTPAAQAAAQEWSEQMRRAFLRGYEEQCPQPVRAPAASTLLLALELDKALYEAVYESQHRPDWLWIPLQAIERICASLGSKTHPTHD